MCALILPVLSFLHYTVSLSLAFFIVCSCISCRPRVDRVVSIVGGIVVIVVVSLVVSPPNVFFLSDCCFSFTVKVIYLCRFGACHTTRFNLSRYVGANADCESGFRG